MRERRLQQQKPRSVAAAVACLAVGAAFAALMLGSGGGPGLSTAQGARATESAGRPALAASSGEGATLFSERCSSCHGPDGRGVQGRAPSLVGVGAAAVDFMLSTGRMPLERPGIQPLRSRPQFSPAQIRAITGFVTSLGPGGPAIPTVDPARGDMAKGRELFAANCSGCHQIDGRGGIGPGFVAPNLTKATPTQVGEAVRVGPSLMPVFTKRQLSDRDVDSLAKFVTSEVRDPADRGGWGIGHIGPIPEGLVALLLGGGLILLVTRAIGTGR